MLPNLSLVLELLGNVFTNFIFEKFLSNEALVTERVTVTSNNQTQLLSSYKWQKLFERCNLRSFDSFRSKFFAKVISRFKSFSLIEYDLWIFPSVFLMEMIDLRGRKLKYAKELLLNHYRKSSQNSMRLQAGHVGRVKIVVTNNLRKMFRCRIHKATKCNTTTRINWDKLTETNS